MAGPKFLDTPQGRRIAYHLSPGAGPGVVFLGGFKSDMEGTKALYLEEWSRARGRAFLRFDYSGHGQSSGNFEDGAIGDWAQDAMAAITALTDGPQVLVGSSMGGWIAALVLRQMPEKLAGLVGIAAAPDFTEDSMWAGFDAAQRAALKQDGIVYLPSDYDAPYPISKRLIEEARRQLVLRSPLRADVPVRLLQGTEDADVSQQVALRLLAHLDGEDIALTLVKGADHRFSEPRYLARIADAVTEVLAAHG